MRKRVVGRLPLLAELTGAAFVASGVYEIYPPAALIFAGTALVFIAQGMERGE